MTAAVGAWSRVRCVKMKPDWNGMTPGGGGLRPPPAFVQLRPSRWRTSTSAEGGQRRERAGSGPAPAPDPCKVHRPSEDGSPIAARWPMPAARSTELEPIPCLAE